MLASSEANSFRLVFWKRWGKLTPSLFGGFFLIKLVIHDFPF